MEPAPILDAIPLPDGTPAPILHRERGILVIDKPPGWRGAPSDPETTARNFQRFLESAAADRNPKSWAGILDATFLRVVQSPDASASGVALIATHLDVARNLSRLFDLPDTRPEQQYLAVVGGKPNHRRWSCCLKLQPDPEHPGRRLTDTRRGLSAKTEFEVLAHADGLALVLATPLTRHPHQIRAHLAAAGLPVVGDLLYGFGRDLESRPRREQRGPRLPGTEPATEPTAPEASPAPSTFPTPTPTPAPAPTRAPVPLALRAVRLAFPGFHGLPEFDVSAPMDAFLARYGFDAGEVFGPEGFDPDADGGGESPDAGS